MACCNSENGGFGRRIALGFAVATAICTLPLLISGGSVTSYGVGMAVPDWPTTFGENMVTYNMLEAPFGVQVEHGHRLIGMVVGLLGMGMVATTSFASVPCRVKWLAGIAFLAICSQGFLGGMRVQLNKAGYGTALAMAHGILGQLTFCLLVITAASMASKPGTCEPISGGYERIRMVGIALPLLWLGQLATGALVRHLGQGFVFHAIIAGLLVVATLAFVLPTFLDQNLRTAFGLASSTLGALALIQVFLGLGAMLATELVPPNWRTWSPSHGEAMIRTAHQVNSALIGALTIGIALRARKLFGVSSSPPGETGLTLEATA